MPRIEDAEDMEVYHIAGSNFDFTGARITNLGSTEYTLVTVAVDVTGSIYGFADELRQSVVAAVGACKKSPRSDNLLLRVLKFSTQFPEGIEEVHGFKPLADIDPNSYQNFQPNGQTPLFEATYSAVGAMVEYGGELMDSDFLVNGIVFIITDGMDNASVVATPMMIREQVSKVIQQEKMESLVTVLVGINTADCHNELASFQAEAGLDQYIDVGDVSSGKLAKLADFVSQSVSSQSLAIGTGGPSQDISATI